MSGFGSQVPFDDSPVLLGGAREMDLRKLRDFCRNMLRSRRWTWSECRQALRRGRKVIPSKERRA